MKKETFIRTLFALIILLLMGIPSVFGGTEIRFGVLANREPDRVYNQWSPLANHISDKLSERVVLVVLRYEDVEAALKTDKIHFLLANSAFYVELKDRYNLEALVTMVTRYQNVVMSEFGGVIFTRNDSPINALDDLRGKRFMCVSQSSLGGGQAAWRLLLDNGINPRKHLASFIEGGIHDNVVRAVLKKEVDAGTIRTDILEKMDDEGKIDLQDFKVINLIQDKFPLRHSTQLYPEWPFIACRPASRDLRRHVAKILHLLSADNKAMVAANVHNWNYPGNYEDVAECLRTIYRSK